MHAVLPVSVPCRKFFAPQLGRVRSAFAALLLVPACAFALDAGEARGYVSEKGRHLDSVEIDGLCGFLDSVDDSMPDADAGNLKNEIWNLLRRQVPFPGDAVIPATIRVFRNKRQPDVVRDYALQHLGMIWPDIETPALRKTVCACLREAAADSGKSFSGTALIALSRSAFDYRDNAVFLRRQATTVAANGNAHPAARVSAFQVAAERGWSEVLPAAENVAYDPLEQTVLRLAAFAAIRVLGDAEDRETLAEWAAANNNRRIAPAVTGPNVLRLVPEQVDFGETDELERPVRTVRLLNGGVRPVAIREIVKTCVCSTLESDRKVIAPGESAVLSARLDPNALSGPFRKTFFVKTDDPDSPSVTVPIAGEVRPLWNVLPGRSVSVPAGGNSAVFEITPVAGAPELGVPAVSGPGSPAVSAEKNGDGKVVLSFSPPLGLPAGHHDWVVAFGGAGHKTLELKVGADVGSAFRVVPARLRAPRRGGDFKSELRILPVAGYRFPDGFESSAAKLLPAWDGVSLTPVGRAPDGSAIFEFAVAGEQLVSWAKPKTFSVSFPGFGYAEFRLDLVPSSVD